MPSLGCYGQTCIIGTFGGLLADFPHFSHWYTAPYTSVHLTRQSHAPARISAYTIAAHTAKCLSSLASTCPGHTLSGMSSPTSERNLPRFRFPAVEILGCHGLASKIQASPQYIHYCRERSLLIGTKEVLFHEARPLRCLPLTTHSSSSEESLSSSCTLEFSPLKGR